MDVTVEVRPAGFELLWVIKSKAGVAELVRRFGTSGHLLLPTTMTTDQGVSTTVDADGGLVVRTSTGTRIGGFGSPVMWDTPAAVGGRGPAEDRGVVEPVAFQAATATAKAGKVSRRVDVAASVAWLNQPQRRFPITFDPTYATDYRAPAFDAFVQQGYTTDQSTDTELKLGNNGAGQVARTFFNWDNTLFKGRTIVSASLSMFAKYSCVRNAAGRPTTPGCRAPQPDGP